MAALVKEPTTALRWQIVIWRDGDNLWGDPEKLLAKFLKKAAEYRCVAEHEGRKSGRKHYHCYIRFKKPYPRQALAVTFGQNIRKMDGDDFDNAKYISEDGKNPTFSENGTKKKHWEQNAAITVDNLLKDGKSVHDIIEEYVELRGYINQNKHVLNIVEQRYNKKRDRELYESPGELYAWQRHVINRIETDPHPRHIDWYLDREGDIGKSTLTDYLYAKHNAVEWSPCGKQEDVTYQLGKDAGGRAPRLIVCDIEANQARNICWSAVERAKNGKCQSGKYGGEFNYRGQRPHIVVFSNENPVGNSLMANRINIHEVVDRDVISSSLV